MNARHATPLAWIFAGIATWALHFALVYGGAALACARGVPHLVPWAIAAPTVLAAAALLALGLSARKAGEEFVHWVAAGIAAIALVAVAWEALAVLRVPPCA